MTKKSSAERKPSELAELERRISESSESLSPIPGAAPPEEPQVDEVIRGEDEEEEEEEQEDEDEEEESDDGRLPG